MQTKPEFIIKPDYQQCCIPNQPGGNQGRCDGIKPRTGADKPTMTQEKTAPLL
jgi:hypothetical protein